MECSIYDEILRSRAGEMIVPRGPCEQMGKAREEREGGGWEVVKAKDSATRVRDLPSRGAAASAPPLSARSPSRQT